MQNIADAEKIKRWREERCWSQEHLADMADIGVRTIQRIENGDKASRDTVMALAAAFNVDVMALTVNAKTEAASVALQKIEDSSAALRLSFGIHLASYIFGMLLFIGISITDGSGYFTMRLPAIWWTVGVAGHALPVIFVELITRHKRLTSSR